MEFGVTGSAISAVGMDACVTAHWDGVRTPFERASDMTGDRASEWLTYEQAAERLGVTPEAARQKAIRGRWQRSRGNDGKAVKLAYGFLRCVRTPFEPRPDVRMATP